MREEPNPYAERVLHIPHRRRTSLGEIDQLGNPDLSEEVSEQLDQIPHFHFKKRGQFVTFMALTNTLLGAGATAVASTFKTGGIGPICIVLLVACTLSHVSSTILLNLQTQLHILNMEQLMSTFFGKKGSIFVSIAIILFNITCAVSVLIIACNQIKQWLGLAKLQIDSSGYWALLVLIYTICIPGALSIPKNIPLLTIFNTLTSICLMFYAIAVSVRSCVYLADTGISPTAYGYTFTWSFFTSIGVATSTFCLPALMLPEIAQYNPNLLKRETVIGVSLLACFLITALPGFFGYLVYGSDSKSDVLMSFPKFDTTLILVRVAIFVVATTSFPKTIQAIATSVSSMIWGQTDLAQLSTRGRLSIVIPIELVSLGLAMVFRDITPIIGFGGALPGGILTYILPPLLWLIHNKCSARNPQTYLLVAYIVFGVVTAGIGTYSSIADAIETYKSPSSAV